MEAMIVELIEVIQKEVCAFQRLVELLEVEQQALVRHEVAAIETVLAEKHETVVEAAVLEEERIRIVERLSDALQEDPASLTLKRLIERVGGPQSERLGEMRETLIALQEKIQMVNRHNTLLIKQSMKYVDKSLRILTGGEGSGGVYVQSGKIENGPSPDQGVVDQVV